MLLGRGTVLLVAAIGAIGVGIVLLIDAPRLGRWTARFLSRIGTPPQESWRENGVPPWVVRLVGLCLLVLGTAVVLLLVFVTHR